MKYRISYGLIGLYTYGYMYNHRSVGDIPYDMNALETLVASVLWPLYWSQWVW